MSTSESSSSRGQRGGQPGSTEKLHHPFQVVDDDRQTHLRLRSSTTAYKKMPMTKDMEFQSGERIPRSIGVGTWPPASPVAAYAEGPCRASGGIPCVVLLRCSATSEDKVHRFQVGPA